MRKFSTSFSRSATPIFEFRLHLEIVILSCGLVKKTIELSDQNFFTVRSVDQIYTQTEKVGGAKSRLWEGLCQYHRNMGVMYIDCLAFNGTEIESEVVFFIQTSISSNRAAMTSQKR